MRAKTKRNILRLIRCAFISGAVFAYSAAAFAAVANNALPVPADSAFISGSGSISSNTDTYTMNVVQNGANAVIKWDSFDVGANATVNFTSAASSFNTLNYVNGGNMSQIYGTINAAGGNIFLVNPAGVNIGKSAQINVGSLHVSNRKIDTDGALQNFDGTMDSIIKNGTATSAILMSLGNINADKVTFDGDKIIIDLDRVIIDGSDGTNAIGNELIVNTTNADNVVLGYTAYDDKNNTYTGAQKSFEIDEKGTLVKGYMWVENLEQLQAINTNLSGNYALHNSIDATSTAESAFEPIGDSENPFTGKFDGLAYLVDGVEFSIFDLNVKRAENVENDSEGKNVGLFGYIKDASISNVILVTGTASGVTNVGGIAGSAVNSVITNSTSSMDVSGVTNVGGIVGYADATTLSAVTNTGAVTGFKNAGGIAGYMKGGTLNGGSYNLGAVTGDESCANNDVVEKDAEDEDLSYSHNIGGLVGSAEGVTIENVSNQMDVRGGYNVGGIAGSAADTDITDATNSADITATGYTSGTYTYHSGNVIKDSRYVGGTITETVNIANVGGIVGTITGGTLKSVTNDGGNVASILANETADYYIGGNVGGIAGSAADTDITDALNNENYVYGAHNVGGVVGYVTGSSTISNAINAGGEIVGTGAVTVDESSFVNVTETVRANSSEAFIIGNIGGIAGYMDGDDVYITQSNNRGNVHSLEIADQNNITNASKAANVGGIVGKIDRSTTHAETEIESGSEAAAVSDSFNTGLVQGYTGVGGVVGMMYNGEVYDSYNIGTVLSTRQAAGNTIEPLNMGGIVGDSTEDAGAAGILIYNCYNAGQIGDDTYTYYGRHVGGIVGRLTGSVDQCYNTGAIYNAYNVVGGIAGFMLGGTLNGNSSKITNSFNTGDITVYNQNNATSQTGGIVGAIDLGSGNAVIENVYNLGTVKSYKVGTGANSVGGIVGGVVVYKDYVGAEILSGATTANAYLTINNVYTTDAIYKRDSTVAGDGGSETKSGSANEIYGNSSGTVTISNAYVITGYEGDLDSYAQATAISKEDSTDATNWESFVENSNGDNTSSVWRLYDGTTPILNVFQGNLQRVLGGSADESVSNYSIFGSGDEYTVQYGTAEDPLENIITADSAGADVSIDFSKLIDSNGETLTLRVNESITYDGGSLSLSNFAVENDRYYAGNLTSGGTLTVNSESDIKLGSASELTGTAVVVSSTGDITANGSITADNSINITAASFASKGTITANGTNEEGTGTVSITATEGDLDILYGVRAVGKLTAAGDVTITAAGNIYIDSDMDLSGNLTLNAAEETILDITNVGKIAADGSSSTENELKSAFLANFSGGNTITFSGNTDDAKITVDMWDYDAGTFAFDQYDVDAENTFFSAITNLQTAGKAVEDLVYVWISSAEQLQGIQDYYEAKTESGGATNILSSNFALKNNINANYLDSYTPIGTGADNGYTGTFDGRGNAIVGLNVNIEPDEQESGGLAGVFAMLGEGSTVKNLEVVSSRFEGAVAGAIAGINLGTIEGIKTFGNRIETNGYYTYDLYAFDGTASTKFAAAGGIAGINDGTISSAEVSDAVIAGVAADADNTVHSMAGGVAGVNVNTISNVTANSAVTSSSGEAEGLGGIAGVSTSHEAAINDVVSLGIVNGVYGEKITDNVGGVVGVLSNGASLDDAYSEAYVYGNNNVGGIIGMSTVDDDYMYTDDDGTEHAAKTIYNSVNNIFNAGPVTGTGENTGGLIGYIDWTEMINARNTDTITGEKNVGGIVGYNGANSLLNDVINDGAATISGIENVGGIAGYNAGTIDAKTAELTNDGEIYGYINVGGIAGYNTGTIANVNSDITLYVNNDIPDDYEFADEYKDADGASVSAKYFGGVTGYNAGTITNATNLANITAEGASYVGGITGHNAKDAVLQGFNGNYGDVTGTAYVGGAIGYNEADINTSIDADTGAVIELEIVNEGTVTAAAGGAGGIIAVNTGNITNATLSNSGTVSGSSNGDTDGTGGVIGSNSGDITYSSLINTVDGIVSGTNNVGGLIGYNTGKISGGRYVATAGEDGGTITETSVDYYANQIYNNGTVSGTDNVGGLIGSNAAGGSLTAGYNTGKVTATAGTAGGIAGSNAGSVDQVFNSVSVLDEYSNITTAAITGATAGGIAGINSGTLTNAYNTTAVSGTTAGSIVGSNSGTVQYVYAINDDTLSLVGSGSEAQNGYSFTSGSSDLTSMDYYEGFNITSSVDDAVWRIYEGYSSPLLKVFLTKATFTQTNAVTYDALEHAVVVATTSDDGKTVNVYLDSTSGTLLGTITAGSAEDAHSIADYLNSVSAEDAVNLLNSSTTIKNAGTYTNILWSTQIKSSVTAETTFNPNNLGYDFLVSLVANDKGETTTTDPELEPTTPGDSGTDLKDQISSKYNWKYLYKDAPFDRERNFRERKAEVNFVDGGAKI